MVSKWRERAEREAWKYVTASMHENELLVLKSASEKTVRELFGHTLEKYSHFIAGYLSCAESERKRSEKLVTALEHIQGMAGNPDASEGCRNIIKRAQEALNEYEARR